MRINNNIMAFNAQRNLTGSANAISKSLEKLSSGFRINRAADDAAGLVISQGLRAQVSGLKQATRNAQDGISVVQTAEGALTEVHAMLNRMRDLAVQTANTGSQDSAAIAAAQEEFDQLRAEIDRIADDTQFGGMKLLNGGFGVKAASTSGFTADKSAVVLGANNAIDFDFTSAGGADIASINLTATSQTAGQTAAEIENQVRSALIAAGGAANLKLAENFTVTAKDQGAGAVLEVSLGGLTNAQTFTVSGTAATALSLSSVTAASGSGGVFQVGANAGETIEVSIDSVSASALGLSPLNLSSDASAAITALDTAIGTVSSLRGDLGAKQNRFESTISNLQVTTENLSASESRIRDTDMAAEMVNLTKNQILQQAGTAMLAQANQLPQSILALLG